MGRAASFHAVLAILCVCTLAYNAEAAALNSAKGALPVGWEEATDARSGRVYYWHRKTLEATWERPQAAGPGPPRLPPRLIAALQVGRGAIARVKRAATAKAAVGDQEQKNSASAPLLGAYLATLMLGASVFL
mgnify:CR=1 FL=1|jgi:hypothetical protein